jgi:hypothetical protein
MSDSKSINISYSGLWFAGWLFTWAFAQPVWWKIILGIVVWPYFLGSHLVS